MKWTRCLLIGENMKLYGTDACADCIIARKLLEKYNQLYEWIDVSDIPDFEGEIPRLEICDVPSTCADKPLIAIGLNSIAKYLKECKW